MTERLRFRHMTSGDVHHIRRGGFFRFGFPVEGDVDYRIGTNFQAQPRRANIQCHPLKPETPGCWRLSPRKKNMAMALRLCKIRHLSLHAMKLREAVLLPALAVKASAVADGRPTRRWDGKSRGLKAMCGCRPRLPGLCIDVRPVTFTKRQLRQTLY